MKIIRILQFALLTSAFSMARAEEQATPAEDIHVMEGFKVELLYSVPRSEGSWIAMCFDDAGRIYAVEQGRRLFRITPAGQGEKPLVELVSDEWASGSQGMTFINKQLYIVRNGNREKDKYVPDSLVRVKDTDNDDKLDTLEHLCDFSSVPGEQAPWTEHALHAPVLSPDGKSIYIVSGDRNHEPTDKSLVPPHWNQDAWGMQYNPKAYSGGWVIRTDLDGKDVTLYSMGLRNCYDIAFNQYGDLFTYDSDLEFDIGLPVYRPTAIRHVLSGVDAGWGGRGGHMIKSFGADFEEIQAPVKNIGPGSPTGVCFGYGAAFPARYQQAMYSCDWSYGRLFAVHLKPKGASYTAETEILLSAQGLPIADIAVSPKDGALYFVVGGRGTQSGLYRVSYTGDEPTVAVQAPELPKKILSLRAQRSALESFYGKADPKALDVLWPSLAHEDRSVRSAARIALEWQPVETWKTRALSEENPRIKLQALLALARSSDGEKAVQQELLAALEKINFSGLGADEKTWLLRILTISNVRHGAYTEETAAALVKQFEGALPDSDRRVNVALVTMLTHLNSEGFVDPTLSLLEKSRTQEEQIVYVESLLRMAPGHAVWTDARRQRFFDIAAPIVSQWKGGSKVPPLRNKSFDAVVARLSEEQKIQLADKIKALQKTKSTATVEGRSFVKNWTMEELEPLLKTELKKDRDLERGRLLYVAGACINCHHYRGEGGLAGPDLSHTGGQYTAYDLLDNIINPSKVINEQYGLLIYKMKDGSQMTGRTVNMVGHQLMIAQNPMFPGEYRKRVSKKLIESIESSPVSFMPPGLLNTFTAEDILDLLAYLRQLSTS